MMNAVFDRQCRLGKGGIKSPIRATFTAAALCVAATITGLFAAPAAFAAGAIKAAYVEPVLPSKPFSAFLPSGSLGAGPSTGTLGITSLTASNGDNTRHTIYIFVTEVVGPTCTSAAVSSAGRRLLTFVVVPAQSQVHMTFPSPLVVEPIVGSANGLTCLTRTALNSLEVMVNGFSN